MGYGLLKLFLTVQQCDSSEQILQGCFAAVNALAGYSGAQILPKPMVSTHPTADEVPLGTFGPFVVRKKNAAKKPKTELSSAEYMKQMQKDAAERDAALQQLLKADEVKTSDFIAMIEFLTALPTAAKEEREAELSAHCINTYYATAIDAHTHIDPRARVISRTKGEKEILVGIGAMLTLSQQEVVVLSPMENSPALKAGLRSKDIIQSVDGVPVRGLSLDVVIAKILGKEGTQVKLKIKRKGQALNVAITRKRMVIEDVTSRILEDRGVKLGLIRMNDFNSESSCAEVERAIFDLELKGAKGLILDLRGNPGGLLDQALCVSGLFLGPNQVVTQEKILANNRVEVLRSPLEITPTRLPMITLIDGGSASASEIVAGALQDHGRSWIAGARSYGKATVQGGYKWNVGPILFENIVIFRTVARFYQPSGRTNQVVGIIPDFLLDPIPFATDEDRFVLREADLFKIALPAQGPTWKQTRLSEANAVQRCFVNTSQGEALFKMHLDDAVPPDYELLEAQDLLVCSDMSPVSLP